MKKLLGVFLVLCLAVTLFCALTFNANAAAETKKLDMMNGTDYAIVVSASNDGATVTYTKNKQVTLTDSGGDSFDGWVQEIVTVTDEATDEWNTKFYYDKSISRYVLILKDAKLDSFNNDTNAAAPIRSLKVEAGE